MRALAIIFVLALITIAGEIYSETGLKMRTIGPNPADALTSAVEHGAKRE
jgi:hypothetical protein